jgi:HD-GYP domain-containing protein (c-di-GMP phosphodiesterase class II)
VLPSPGGNQPALHYLVLELVSGGDLEQYVYANGPRPVAQGCEWARQVASGLLAAHDRHLIHRDVKPSNLLLTADHRVKLIDFGLARELTSTRTVRGSLIGSLEFMAPEQSADPTAVGPPADVYGLGVTLLWALTGQLPHPRGRNTAETVKLLQTGTPRRASEFRPDVPAELDEFLVRMLARNPMERPTLPEVMQALAPFAEEPQEATVAPFGLTPTSIDFNLTTVADQPAVGSTRLRETARQLEASLAARELDVRRAEDAVLFAMGRMATTHDGGSAAHSRRMQEYVRVLAEQLTSNPDWPVLMDGGFIADLVRCVPLHDIGKIGISDAILEKPGPLTTNELALVESHTILGCELLERLGRAHGDSLTFQGMARAVVRSHHERWDGAGYPDGLAGEHIPPAARLVAIADVYDSLRRDRADRPGLDHIAAVAVVQTGTGQFDPAVLAAFEVCESAIEQIYATVPDDGARERGVRNQG